MHTRLWIAAAFAATPILALSPVAFPGGDEAGCAKTVAGARYNQRLFRVARSIVGNASEAEDVVQQAYVCAYANLEQFAGEAA